MTVEQLNEILTKHRLFLNNEKGGSKADLSGAEGLLSTVNYLDAHFERTENGYVAYKTFNSMYSAPEKWNIAPGSVIEETVNFDRCTECGCGINVAPLDWVKANHDGTIWKVLIRCERVELLEVVE